MHRLHADGLYIKLAQMLSLIRPRVVGNINDFKEGMVKHTDQRSLLVKKNVCPVSNFNVD